MNHKLRKIEVPALFLDRLSKASQKEFLSLSEYCKHTVVMTQEEYHKVHCDIDHGNPYNRPNIADRFQDMLKVEYDGFVFVSEEVDKDKLELFELKQKAKELDELKKSLANIKNVIGDVK